jgi:hypothetical protein
MNILQKKEGMENDTETRAYYKMDYTGVSILIFIFKNRTYYKTSTAFH